MVFLNNAPWWLRLVHTKCRWEMPRNKNEVYLTFDDGPHEIATTFVLSQLAAYNAKATFFCIGKNVLMHPELIHQMKENGHLVGNHTMFHGNGGLLKNDVYLHQVAQAASYTSTQWFRPPYGRIRSSQIQLLQKQFPDVQIVLWSVLAGDFDTSKTGAWCTKKTIQYLRPGSIIVFHDSAKALPRLQIALPLVLQYIQQKGWSMGTLADGIIAQ